MRIGLDIDGIILDFERTMRSYAELYDLLILRKDGIVDSKQFNYLKRYDWTEEERKRFIDNFLLYATVNSTPLIPLVREMLELFQLEGYEYVFITARGILKKEAKEAVMEVFQRNHIPTDHIYWEVKDKASKCKELGIDVMIEDNPNTCKLLIDNQIRTLYFRDKNNEILDNNEFLTEVSNVGEICRYLINLNGFKNSPDTYQKILLKETKSTNN